MATVKERLTENAKRNLPFTIETMKRFNQIAEAIKYFSDRETPIRRKSIVNLFNEAHELNFGSVSLNMAVFKNDPKTLNAFIERNKLFANAITRKRLDVKIKNWFGKAEEIVKAETEVLIKQSVTSENDAQSANSPTE
ncbi:hypothetical protein UFOVP611_11 [uncultured Caudovirales phage]|uniref:Uncharacterized protein n=1 Tax=uncultured Caudovirales phage TaxID=2100421 RepID=A0A6J5N1A8_9CAUD|nr:hypothetical protein UFOVP611_11 [uncultured Caudovirales phage]